MSIINDEISPDLEECVSFYSKHRVDWIELRSFNQINILNLSDQRLHHIAKRLNESGINVSCIASPLFKWDLNGDVSSKQFSFKKADTEEYYIDRSIYVAQVFKCKRIRVFSFLESEKFHLQMLTEKLAPLLEKANQFGISILLENEPICNIKLVKQLGEINRIEKENIFPLVDLGNDVSIGNRFFGPDEQHVIESCHYFHIKDYDVRKNKYVSLGRGDVPFKELFSFIIKGTSKFPTFLSLETHTGRQQDTLDSLNNLRTLCL